MLISGNTNVQRLINMPPAQSPIDPLKITRHKRETEISVEPAAETLTRNDRSLAKHVAEAIVENAARPDPTATVYVTENSTFGQWWAQLGRAMAHPAIREWAIEQGISDARTLMIAPEKGEISFKTAPKGLIKTFGPGDKQWSAISGSILAAAKVVAEGSGVTRFHPPIYPSQSKAPLSLVSSFYGMPQRFSPEQAREYASVLQRDQVFPDEPAAAKATRSEEALDKQRSQLGDHINAHEAKRNLTFLSDEMRRDNAPDALIEEYLRGQEFNVHPDSSYPEDRQIKSGRTNLLQYLEHNGLAIPTNQREFENLAAGLLNPPPQSPPHANYGGALAWPIPLDDDSEVHLKTLLSQKQVGDINLSPFKNVAEYLMGDLKLTYAEARQPRQLIDRLIQSPKGQALGKALQAEFEARSVKGSVNDWLLAALSIDPDDKAPAPGVSPKARMGGAMFAVPEEAGRSASSFVGRLAEAQVIQGKASNLNQGWVKAHLLLSTRAPEYLVKDIPDKVAFGTHSWVSFVTAVGRLEAKAPGSTSTMTYSEVMSQASIAPITVADRQAEYLAQHEALKDWGAANGMPYPQTAAQMNTIREAFNAQIGELKAASEAFGTPMPTGKDLALKYLKEAMPDMDPALFEKKCITLYPANVDYKGPYSILDLYLQDKLILNPPTPGVIDVLLGVEENSRWVSSSKDVNINEFLVKYASKRLPAIPELFKRTFSEYCEKAEKGISAQLKYMISQQPLGVRKAIENGEITLLREDKIGWGPVREGTSSVIKPHVKNSENNNPLLKVKYNGRTKVYEIDLKNGALKERDDLNTITPGTYPRGSTRYDTEYVALTPRSREKYPADITHEKTPPTALPNSFASEKTSYLADAYVHHVNIPKFEAQARGATTFDRQIKISEVVSEVLLNLIPGRSAIVNFMEGKIAEGFAELGLDAMGFLIPGSSAATKSAKAISTATSVFGKVLRVSKIVGRTAIGALNPVDGLADLVKGGTKLTHKGFNYFANTGSYDLASAAKRFDASSLGTFKLQGTIAEGPAVLTGGKWHAYDAVSGTPFGKALDDFVPSLQKNVDELGDWATGPKVRSKKVSHTINKWEETVKDKKSVANKAAFEAGYALEKPVNVSGFSENMKPLDLMALVEKNPNLTAEQVGSLVKQYDNLLYSKGKASVTHFHESQHGIGIVRGVPQTAYLSLTSQFSNGQCAALSRTMATAVAEGKSTTFIRNLRRAAAMPKDPKSIEFMRTLKELQDTVSGASVFHARQPVRQVTYQNMIKELGEATGSKSVMIEMPNHAMTAGVSVKGTTKTYYFYDPNLGVVEFSSLRDMERGLDKLFNHKHLKKEYRSVGTDIRKLEFKISDVDDAWQDLFSINKTRFKKLYEQPI